MNKFRHFSYKGRIGQLDYFVNNTLSKLFIFSFTIIWLFYPNYNYRIPQELEITIVISIFALYLYSNICLKIRRLHDINLPGTYYFILIIPLVNIFYGIYLYFALGTKGQNRYGSDPKGRNILTDADIQTPINSQDDKIYYILMFCLIFCLSVFIVYFFISKGPQISEQLESRKYDFYEEPVDQIETIYSISENPKYDYEGKYLSYDSLRQILASLYNDSLRLSKRIELLTEPLHFDLVINDYHNNIIVQMNLIQLKAGIDTTITEYGFKRVSPKILGNEKFSEMEYKTFMITDGEIYLHLGSDYESIHYFLDYMIDNYYRINDKSKLHVKYDL